jgi:hypothetical protein
MSASIGDKIAITQAMAEGRPSGFAVGEFENRLLWPTKQFSVVSSQL